MSQSSEYICISCWTPFEGVPDTKRELTCPHCGFVQPAGSDPSATAGDNGNPGDMTMQDMRAPWLDTSKGDDPVSFDNLDQLERLLGNSGQSAPVIQSTKSSDKTSELPEETPPPKAVTPDTSTEVQVEAVAPSTLEAVTTDGGPTIWRLKSDTGMTYSFFSLDSLVRWADGLAPQEKAAMTSDGVVWKRLRDFRAALEDNDDLSAAFEAAPEPKIARAASAPGTRTTGSITRPPTKHSTTQTRRRPTRTSTATKHATPKNITAERQRPSGMAGVSSEMEELMKAASASEDGGRSATKKSPRRSVSGVGATTRTAAATANTARSRTTASTGSSAMLFLLGAVLGAVGVYFGMYALGFYDLVFTL